MFSLKIVCNLGPDLNIVSYENILQGIVKSIKILIVTNFDQVEKAF